MRYAGISVQKYDVKTHKNHENTGSVPVRSPALSPERQPEPRPRALPRPGKPCHGKACPVAPASTRAPVTTFVRSPAGNPGTVVCHVAALRLPSRACRKGARHTNRPPFRGHAAEPRLPSLYNIHQCSSFALLPVESRASRSPHRQWPFGNGTCRIPVSFLPRPVFRKDFCQLPRPFRPSSCIDMDTRNVYDCILNFVEQFQHITRQICSPIAARP